MAKPNDNIIRTSIRKFQGYDINPYAEDMNSTHKQFSHDRAVSMAKRRAKSTFLPVPFLVKYRAVLLCGAIGFFALSSEGATSYTIEYGLGTSPFAYRLPTTDYQIDATGMQNQQGIHGFAVHHSGADTYADIPGENYSIFNLHVNNLGQVSGTVNANYGGFGCNSFFWDQGQLTLFPGKEDVQVYDMNNLGQVVGDFFGDYTRHGFIWDNGAYETYKLSDYLTTVEYNGESYNFKSDWDSLNAINDNGQLSGDFFMLDLHTTFWYIATPVPEPGVMALLSLGLLGLVGFRSRFRVQV